MERKLIKELYLNKEKEVKIQGWVHRIRKLGRITFLILRDRTGIVQCIIDNKSMDIKGMKLESVIEVKGLVKEKQGDEKEVEVEVSALNVISAVKEDIPIEINKMELECNLDSKLNNRVIALRHIKTNAIFQIQAKLAQGFQEFLINEGFTQVFTPKIVAAGTEGGTELFPLKYFEKTAYLAQSPQFYKQMLVGAGYERVFEIAHVYRAEEHNTQRHLNEYVSMDLEVGFIEDEKEIMALEERLLKYMLNKLAKDCLNELEILQVNMPKMEKPIPSLRLSEAIEILKTKYNRQELENDLDPEGERQICEYAKEELESEFIFLTHYPRIKRPMYAMPAEETLTHSFDLLFRGLEITTGGQRIHNYEQLVESIAARGLNPYSFEDYLKVFKYGMPPHGGLAIGLERLTAQLLGIKNIRETCLFPRDRERITP